MRFRLFRRQRIRSENDFRLFRASRSRERGAGFLLVRKHNDDRHCLPRVALVASRKIGNAVRRNHLRRVFREEFRHRAVDISRGEDFLVVFLAQSKTLDPWTMGKDFADRLRRQGKR
ncbi:MAG: ribonuclease P protein component [Puniceicoccales bacterium]|jgi:ribonuclease P protein component|nr:ribonuclease P protein component [Puniceicoccales bacterium]